MTDSIYEMKLGDVTKFYRDLEEMGVLVWLDGGWGVDALLGMQSRAHSDLDVIIQEKDTDTVRAYLANQGYKIIPRDDLSKFNFHMGDNLGHEIDFTVIVFDEKGNGIYGPRENDEMNPADSFAGLGKIGELKVRCVAPEYAVSFRTGYELSQKDYLDVSALCGHFNIELPKEYTTFAIDKSGY